MTIGIREVGPTTQTELGADGNIWGYLRTLGTKNDGARETDHGSDWSMGFSDSEGYQFAFTGGDQPTILGSKRWEDWTQLAS